MLGSMTYSILSCVQRKRHHPNVSGCGGDNNTSIAQTWKSLRYVFLAAAISFFWTVVFKESYFVALFAFCAFEFGLGVYWPAMAVLRGELVPNSLRASVLIAWIVLMGCHSANTSQRSETPSLASTNGTLPLSVKILLPQVEFT